MQHRQTSLENMNTGKDMHGIGQLLVDFCGEQKLVIANTLFRLHNRHRYTLKNPDGATMNSERLHTYEQTVEAID